MPSLVQLLAHHDCILVLDAAGTTIHTGLLQVGSRACWHSSSDEAGKSLFLGADTCLRQAGRTLADVKAFAFCEGPGSMLGIRTAAMAIRTWQAEAPRPAYHYSSLPLLALELARRGQSIPFSVIADARRDTWHISTVTPSGLSPLRRAPSAELAGSTEPLIQPMTFRAWSAPPRLTLDCAYDPAALLAAHSDQDVFVATERPDAFQHEAPEYKRWSAQVHSAVTAPPR